MKLYLVRHGEAVTAVPDSERPLTAKGKQQTQKLADHLLQLNLGVEHIYHSSILRAQQTADLLAKSLLPTQKAEFRPGLLPDSSVEAFAAELQVSQESMILVGHLPFMSELVSSLVLGNPNNTLVDFQPSSLVCLTRYSSRWLIEWTLSPSLLEAMSA